MQMFQLADTQLIQSPLNYTGGKYKLLPQILPLFPQGINCFVDLFCGGCNVGINVDSNSVVYNDIDEHLFYLFNTLKNLDKEVTFELIFKIIKDYDLDDWYEILEKTGVGIAKGGVRGISIYALTNYAATPAAVANSLCTISFGLAHQLYLYRNGVIDQYQFLINSENLCLDCSVSAMSSLFGQVLIPIPVIGAVVGNSVGTLLCQLLRDQLTSREKKKLKDYLKQLEILDSQLDQEYQTYIKQINDSLINYYNLLESAFSPDYRVAFDSSIALAKSIGISDDQILKNKQEIDDYFLR